MTRESVCKAISVHNMGQAVCALQAAKELSEMVWLKNAEGSHAYAGLPYITAIFDEAEKEVKNAQVSYIFDAGDDAALAVEAIDKGWKYLRFSGEEKMRQKIEDIANQYGIKIVKEMESLDLHGIVDSFQACKDWLNANENKNLEGINNESNT